MASKRRTTDVAYALVARFTLAAGTPQEVSEVQVWRAGTYDSPDHARNEWIGDGRDEADIVGFVPINASEVV